MYPREGNIYYFLIAILFIQSSRMPASACNINFASHDEILLNGDSSTDEDQHEEFIFVVTKVFNRHNDICSGVTEVKDGDVIISENSSITELNIELKTLRDCNRNAVYHISDISKEILPALSFEAIADVTGAVIAMGTNVLSN